MIMNKKGITPIISVILLLMMSVAVAGIAWFWLQSMTQRVMSQTDEGTQAQLTTLRSSLQVIGSPTCAIDKKSVQAAVYNPGTASAQPSANAAVGSSLGTVDIVGSATTIGAGATEQVNISSATAYATGLDMVTMTIVGGGSVTFGVTC